MTYHRQFRQILKRLLICRTTTVKPVVLAKISTLGKSGDYLPLMKYQECGYSVASGYIVGGELALRGEFPFAVLLGYDTDETNLKEDVAEDVPSPQTVSQNIQKCFLKSTFEFYLFII